MNVSKSKHWFGIKNTWVWLLVFPLKQFSLIAMKKKIINLVSVLLNPNLTACISCTVFVQWYSIQWYSVCTCLPLLWYMVLVYEYEILLLDLWNLRLSENSGCNVFMKVSQLLLFLVGCSGGFGNSRRPWSKKQEAEHTSLWSHWQELEIGTGKQHTECRSFYCQPSVESCTARSGRKCWKAKNFKSVQLPKY